MDAELKARTHALELLITQVISENLRAVPNPTAQAQLAKLHLQAPVDALRVDVAKTCGAGIKPWIVTAQPQVVCGR
jgi:hypothetical protein